MDYFNYKNGSLYAEDVAVTDIAKQVGTPFYCYSSATLTRHYNVFAEGLKDLNANICFAVKSNSNLAVLKTLAGLGAGADCVSEGEIRRSLAAGIDAGKIIFSGVGKTDEELKYALEQNIMQINIESEPELKALNDVAISLGKKAPVAFRVNPNVDAKTHEKIATGRKTYKFGIPWEDVKNVYELAASMEGIEIKGVAVHIGSQLTSLEPFSAAFTKIKELALQLREAGHDIARIDLGGGLGIPYDNENDIPSPSDYTAMVREIFAGMDVELSFEPGRVIAGNAGILVTKVIYHKEANEKDFLIVDAAMNDLIRPTLYEAHHNIVPVRENAGKTLQKPVDVVGPICETGDVLIKERAKFVLSHGELMAIRSAGAYGAVMSSGYNSRLLIPEVLVSGDKFAVTRRRETYEEMLSLESVPDWV